MIRTFIRFYISIFFLIVIINRSYCQKITPKELVGNWETLDKLPHSYCLYFMDSMHLKVIYYGKEFGKGIWTYSLDTLKGNNLIIMSGQDPLGGKILDTAFIRLKSIDTLQIRSMATGKGNSVRIQGIVNEELWNGKDDNDFRKASKLKRVIE
jgi:hypothetical protein